MSNGLPFTSSSGLPVRYEHFIDGRRHPPASGAYFASEDPFTGEAWAEVARGSATDVDAAVAAATRALTEGEWARWSPSERGRVLWKLGDCILANADRLAEVERRDNGKLGSEVVAQVQYMGDYFKYYAGLADKVESAVIPTDKRGVFA